MFLDLLKFLKYQEENCQVKQRKNTFKLENKLVENGCSRVSQKWKLWDMILSPAGVHINGIDRQDFGTGFENLSVELTL